ncbi:MAG: Cysteinyl-tRNA synthetase, partial [uncultured Microvirga sp.]
EHVLFHVPSMPDYGSLSKRPLDEMEAGARVDVAPYKRSPLDFVLWKPSGPRDPSWPSPAGIETPGRPGWHIECSAMSWRHLGERFDIHAGGIDLVFPHHENEVAQSRCSFGTPTMANVWMHNGFLQVEGQKMSKSLGNFVTIQELLRTENFGGRRWSGDVLRLAMLKSPYRDPIDWTVSSLIEAENILDGWWRSCWLLPPAPAVAPEVIAALADDLDTPGAITALHGLRREGRLAELHRSLCSLGFMTMRFHSSAVDASTDFSLDSARSSHLSERAWAVLRDRTAARAAKNWAESDRLRDELAALGVALKDNKDGTTTWEVAR